MKDFRLDIKQVNQSYCSSYFAAYQLGEWGIEVGYKVPPAQISTMNKELMDWQLESDCCALCNASTQPQSFTISSYAVLSPNPCTPLIPLYAGPGNCPCFVNQSLNNKATYCYPCCGGQATSLPYGTCN
jgi:hypothetical protein